MRAGILFITLSMLCIFANAQKNRYDSISKIIQQDSAEYQQELQDIERIKNQTDSILKKDLGHIERITPGPDSATLLKKIKSVAELQMQKKQDEETRRYYLLVAAVMIMIIAVIILFKRNSFTSQR